MKCSAVLSMDTTVSYELLQHFQGRSLSPEILICNENIVNIDYQNMLCLLID